MKFTLESSTATYTIQSYNDHEILVGGQHITQSAIIMAEQLISDWTPQTFLDLKQQHFDQLLALKPELVLLGTGKKLQFPDISMTQALITANIGLEVMTTDAACRTYNVLVSEGREVALAVLMMFND